MFMRQPASVLTRTSAPVADMQAVFSLTIAPEIAGYRTANDPPNPQQVSCFSGARYSTPRT
jgi:hypothetical protein